MLCAWKQQVGRLPMWSAHILVPGTEFVEATNGLPIWAEMCRHLLLHCCR